jgi:hypothetical protein
MECVFVDFHRNNVRNTWKVSPLSSKKRIMGPSRAVSQQRKYQIVFQFVIKFRFICKKMTKEKTGFFLLLRIRSLQFFEITRKDLVEMNLILEFQIEFETMMIVDNDLLFTQQ